MSFKDVRDLSEHLKILGYPNIFPLQALSTTGGTLASFLIVAEILQWLTDLLEPGALPQGELDTEEGRVLFIHSIIEFFITKAGLKLNPRKLYAASAISAVELRKITSMLISPRENHDEEAEERNYEMLHEIDISNKMDNLRLARELSADLTKRGAVMFELLTKEMENKKMQQIDATKVMDMSVVGKVLKSATVTKQLKLKTSHAQLESSRQELNAFSSRIQRKSAELDRTKQRLEALQKIKPTHIQEFEECEKEVSKLFERYFLRIYVRDALLNQLEERNKRTEFMTATLTKPVENVMENLLQQENHNINFNRGVDENFDLNSESSDIRDEDLAQSEVNVFRQEPSVANLTGRRPGSAIQSKRTSAKLDQNRQDLPLNNYWKTGGDNQESSFGSDSDLDMSELIDGRMDAHAEDQLNSAVKVDDSDLNSMDDISISKIPAELPLRPKTANKQEHQSDEDF